jgi:hypothetical protein
LVVFLKSFAICEKEKRYSGSAKITATLKVTGSVAVTTSCKVVLLFSPGKSAVADSCSKLFFLSIVGKFWHRQIQAFCNQHAAFNVVNLSA